MIGGYGCGKTFGGAAAFLALCLVNGEAESLIVAPTGNMLANVTLPAFERFARPLIVDENKNEGWYLLSNRARVGYLSADHPGSLVGRNVSAIWVDEGCEIKHQAWEVIRSRLRIPAKKRQGLVTSTPLAGTWMQKEFDSGNPDRAFVRASTADNYLGVDRKWLDTQLTSMSSTEAKAYFYGHWMTTEGLVYGEFDRKVHLVDYTPRRDLPVYVGVDFGYRWPAVVYAQRQPGDGKLPPGSWVVYDEDVPEGMSTEALAGRMADKLEGYRVGAVYCDPAGASTGQSAAEHAGPTDVDAMTTALYQRGLSPHIDWLDRKTAGHLRGVNTGIEHVRGFLMSAKGVSRLFFARSLEDAHQGVERGILRAMTTYSWQRGHQRPLKGEPARYVDHVADALRYLVRHIKLDEQGQGLHVARYV